MSEEVGLVGKFNADPLEKTLEAWFVAQVRRAGGRAYKFVSPGQRSVPDRLILLPGGCGFFVELKRRGAKATPKQLLEHDKLRSLGFRVYLCDSKESLSQVLADELRNTF